MGQLERYGLYVLVVVIFLILGVAIMGGEPEGPGTAVPRGQLAVAAGGVVTDPGDFAPAEPRSGKLKDIFPGADGANPYAPLPKPTPQDDQPKVPPVLGGPGRIVDEPAPGPAGDVRTPSAEVVSRYRIVQGDSYAKIARKLYGDERQFRLIEAANPGMPASALRIGEEIDIPPLPPETSGPAAGDRVASPSPGPARPAGARVHVVVKGEIMGTIAKRYYGKSSEWRRIADANPQVDPTNMHAGVELLIPESL
jgi:nucleoid-associated protein YgaU